MKQYLAVDIGGTSAKYALVGENGQCGPVRSFATGREMTGEEMEKQLTCAVNWALEKGAQGVGISCLGIIDPSDGRVLAGVENLPCLLESSPVQLLCKNFPRLAVAMENDAKAASLGEMWQGAGQNCRNFLSLVFGTGIGSGLVLEGRLVRGSHFRAGEIGYWSKGGQAWEQEDSACALFARTARRLGLLQLSGQEFFERLRREDFVCREEFDAWAARVGRVMAHVTLLLDLDRILVGGGISAQGAFLTDRLQREMDRFLPPDFAGECRVLPAALGNQAALLGAVYNLLSR